MSVLSLVCVYIATFWSTVLSIDNNATSGATLRVLVGSIGVGRVFTRAFVLGSDCNTKCQRRHWKQQHKTVCASLGLLGLNGEGNCATMIEDVLDDTVEL